MKRFSQIRDTQIVTTLILMTLMLPLIVLIVLRTHYTAIKVPCVVQQTGGNNSPAVISPGDVIINGAGGSGDKRCCVQGPGASACATDDETLQELCKDYKSNK